MRFVKNDCHRKLLVKTDDSVHEFYKNKVHNTGDAGLDLFCPDDVTVNPGKTVWVNLGIKCEMVVDTVDGRESMSYDLRARSSISKTPLRLSNGVGTIDSTYRGYIITALDNIKDETYTIKRGDRLVQICCADLGSFSTEIVDNLSETERGEGGFGSTGK